MPTTSAGVLLCRRNGPSLEVLLAHPGGPFWRNKDLGAWTIPKGEVVAGEELEAAARREFLEELGAPCDARLHPIGSVRQSGGKLVHAFAGLGDFDVAALSGGSFEIEWPPRSGRMAAFAEVDRAAWFGLEEARGKILSAQAAFIDRLEGAAWLDQPDGRPPLEE